MATPEVISNLRQLCTPQDLSNRCSKNVLRQLADDNRSGAADANVLAQVVKDASAFVWSYIADLGVVPAEPAPVPDFVVMLCLDAAQAKLYMRFPSTALGQQGIYMLEAARKDLVRLKDGATAAPATTPTPTGGPEAAASSTFGAVVSNPCRRRFF
jgi:phage gp36-like protein